MISAHRSAHTAHARPSQVILQDVVVIQMVMVHSKLVKELIR